MQLYHTITQLKYFWSSAGGFRVICKSLYQLVHKMIKSLQFSLIVLLQPNSARFQPDHVYWDSKIFSLPYSKWTWETVEKLKKIVASAWVWTHIILGKQKAKTLPLSYGSILQMMTFKLKCEYLYTVLYLYNYKKV